MKKKNGFAQIHLKNIPEDIWVPLFKSYAEKHLSPASASYLVGVTDKNLRKKVFKAIRNEILLKALEEGIERLEKDKQSELDLD